MEFLKILKIKLTYGPAIPLLGIYAKELKAKCYRDICTPMFIVTLFRIAGRWIQPKHMWYIHTMEIISHAITWISLSDVMLSEMSQSQKDKH